MPSARSLMELWMWRVVLLWISPSEGQQTPDSARRAQLPQAVFTDAGQLQPSVVPPRRAGGYNNPMHVALPPFLALMSSVHPQTSPTSPARPPSTQASRSVPPPPAALLPPRGIQIAGPRVAPSPTPAAPNHCLRAWPPTLTPSSKATRAMCSYGLSKRF